MSTRIEKNRIERMLPHFLGALSLNYVEFRLLQALKFNFINGVQKLK